MTLTNKKILVVVNPISGDKDKEPIVKKIKEAVPNKNTLKIFKTTGEQDHQKINELYKDYRADRILVVGGDGTIKLVAECLKDAQPIIGIIPCGSSNGLAKDLDIPKNIEEAIKVALSSCIIEMDSILINDTIGLHISDLGINAELIHNYSKTKVRGYFGYALSSVPTLLNTDIPYTFEIKTENEHKVVSGIMLAFANSKKFGTGALVNPKGKINDGKFEILVFKSLDVVSIFKTLFEEIKMDSDFVEVIQTKQAKVTMEKPVYFQIDGEPHGKTSEVTVKMSANTLKIAVNSSS